MDINVNPITYSQRPPFIFRNYKMIDLVTNPFKTAFPIKKYTTTPMGSMLSTLNTARYGEPFCWFMRMLFGTPDKKLQEATLSPWQFSRLLSTMILLSSGLLKTKKFQKALILNGGANNGKSTFLNLLSKTFPGKCVEIDAKKFFSSQEFTFNDVGEALFVT